MDSDTRSDLLIEPPLTYEIKGSEGVLTVESPLTLNIDDYDFSETTKKWSRDYRTFYKSNYDLFDRRKKNETYVLGKQITEAEKKNELKLYEPRYGDNALWEIEQTIKPLTVQSIPDLEVTPPDEGVQTKEAEQLTKAVDNDNKSEDRRMLLGIATKHLPIYFTAVIKCRWNASIEDYEFYIVHPNEIEADWTCRTNNADKMKHIVEYVSMTVQEAVMRFPAKKDELLAALRADGLVAGEGDPSTKDMQSTFKMKEVWCDWPQRKTDPTTGESKWEIVSMVAWAYKEVVLMKMKNPNYDWEGEENWVTYDDPSNESTKRNLNDQELMTAIAMGVLPPNLQREKYYKNYFDRPRKPYYFFGYDQYHKQPYDETSRIEQNLRNQENLDQIGKQIVQTLKNRFKHVFSKDGGIEAEDLEKMDLEDPDQHLLIDGDVRMTHSVIQPERPDSAQFNALDQQRNRMYGMAGASAVRGQIQSQVATTNQIAREADFSRADDLVADTINPACQWMAEWSLQMIKLRYTAEKLRRMYGDKGVLTYVKLHSDLVSDGMEVMIKSSSTDKVKREKTANDAAQLQFIDPYNYYRDTGKSDADAMDRTEDLMLYQTAATDGGASYLAKLKGLGSSPQELATNLNTNTNQQLGQAGLPPQTSQPPMPGQQPVAPDMGISTNGNGGQPSPTNTAAIPQMQTQPQGSVR